VGPDGAAVSATSVGTAVGRHCPLGTVLPAPPDEDEKDWYAWRSLPYLSAALYLSAVCVITAQAWFEIRNVTTFPLLVTPFAAYTLTYLGYQSISLPVNYAGRVATGVGHPDAGNVRRDTTRTLEPVLGPVSWWWPRGCCWAPVGHGECGGAAAPPPPAAVVSAAAWAMCW
jgi:hypothetical protein